MYVLLHSGPALYALEGGREGGRGGREGGRTLISFQRCRQAERDLPGRKAATSPQCSLSFFSRTRRRRVSCAAVQGEEGREEEERREEEGRGKEEEPYGEEMQEELQEG